MPCWAVCVTRPGLLGNPFTGPGAVDRYEKHLEQILLNHYPTLEEWRIVDRVRAIAAANLSVACFCGPDKDCHGDVILRFSRKIRAGWAKWVEAEEFRGEL